jgi:CDP-diacylglycerol--serine O-phosphatidyltransferase
VIRLALVPFPLKYVVPNAFTAASLVLGLASIACSARGDHELAAWMILWGTLLDKADGTAARLLGATSKFGVEFDSFADFVSFGVAPAALFYFKLGGSVPVAVTAGLYVVALAARLSRFNITTGGESVFHGAPGTLVGAVLASAFLAFDKHHLLPAILAYSPAALAAGAVLMVSTLRIPKLKMRKSKAWNAFQIANLVAGYVLGPLRLFPEYMFTAACVYLVGGLLVGALMPAEEAPAEPAPAPAPAPAEAHRDAA